MHMRIFPAGTVAGRGSGTTGAFGVPLLFAVLLGGVALLAGPFPASAAPEKNQAEEKLAALAATVAAEVKARGPFGFDLRKAFWPYWLHALTRHRWRRSSRAGWFAFSL